MKRIIILSIITYVSFFNTNVFSQTKRLNTNTAKPVETFSTQADSIFKCFSDSLKQISIKLHTDAEYGIYNNNKDLLTNPYYYRLFVNPLLYKSSLRNVMEIDTDNNSSKLSELTNDKCLIVDNAIHKFFISLYTQHPYIVHNTDDILEKSGRMREDINTRIDHKVQISEVVKKKELENVIEPIEAISRKPNFWTFSHNISLQLMQNYSNDKWYQGGINYNSMLTRYTFQANYNNKQKVTFNNKLEMNLGFQTNKDDKEHKFKTTEDLLRLTNNLGVRASGRWYYSIQLQSWTQFHPKYNNNSNVVYSDFMSPFESVLSLGMDYKYSKSKFSFNLHLAPIAYDFKYVDRKALTARYGVKGNHHSYETIGSNITATWNWQILKELSWHSRMYYFTNYEKIQVEWENTFNFAINKYLSSKLYLYPRFDDSYTNNNSDAVIQFKEYLSLGLNLSF